MTVLLLRAAHLSDTLCGDNPILNNGKCTLQLKKRRSDQHPVSSVNIQPQQETSCVYPFRKKTKKPHPDVVARLPWPDLQPVLGRGPWECSGLD